jgi:hypothetical protein
MGPLTPGLFPSVTRVSVSPGETIIVTQERAFSMTWGKGGGGGGNYIYHMQYSGHEHIQIQYIHWNVHYFLNVDTPYIFLKGCGGFQTMTLEADR